MKLETLVVGIYAVNCYLYWDENTNEGLIFDPGEDAVQIISAIEKLKFTPQAIMLTHGHGDHIGAVTEVKSRWELPVYIGKGEEGLLSDPLQNSSALLDNPIVAAEPDNLVEDEKIYSFGSISLRVLHTPGHTPAGVCYLDEQQGLLFCGDTLFQSSIGRTDLPGGSFEALIDSIQKKILPLPDDIICLPGHGPATTVGAEKSGNPFLQGRMA